MPEFPWRDRRLIELLGIAHPIVQAPMKGTSTPALAAAVSEAGGLGSLGCAGLGGDELRSTLAGMRRRTNRAFNVNFLIHDAVSPAPADVERTRERVAGFYAEKGIGAPPATIAAASASFGADQLDALLADPPPVVSFHFGLPPGEVVARLRASGTKVLCTATSVGEARALAAAGVDAIVAQGVEAGGHRGCFADATDEPGTGLIALLPQVVDAVAVPVIAAGGIADGRGIAAALALGAAGVQIGTAFVPCPESSATPAHRAAIAAATDRSSRITCAVSGRPARARRTRYIEAMAPAPGPLLPFPLMYQMTEPLLATGDPDLAFLLHGEAAPLARAEPAADLVARLVGETAGVLARIGA